MEEISQNLWDMSLSVESCNIQGPLLFLEFASNLILFQEISRGIVKNLNYDLNKIIITFPEFSRVIQE